MYSGSLKDLSKAITSFAPNLTTPLPDELLNVINAYLIKHATYDESDSNRLQEELFNIYEASIIEHPSRLAPFLAILRLLKPSIRGSGRLLQWWDKLSTPTLIHLGVEKGLALEAKNTLLSILVYDEEEEGDQLADAKTTSDAVAESLLATWLVKTKIATEEFEANARFVESQLQLILLSFGKKRPKDFLTTINKFFVKKDSRILALSVLCEFIRHQPPHLHQMLQTPLFENLLRCLQSDTSTRVISLAMTALIMFLPHMPNTASKHLPALFNIYTRMLFWDRERKAAEILPRDPDDEKSEKQEELGEGNRSWEKMTYLLESEDETVPELLHYFTFLYGLYPINFMSYIRKPQRYLRHANFPGADDLDIEPTEVRQRSEPFRQVHLLHPNFFMLTIESELTDNNRFLKSEAADVLAECMALYVPSEDINEHNARPRGPVKNVEANEDVPEQSLLLESVTTPIPSRHTSWKNPSYTTTSPEGGRTSGLQRQLSQTSQSIASMGDSPSNQPEGLDSPTIPPTLLGSSLQLSDMLNHPRSTRASLYKSLTNDSAASLGSTHQEQSHIDTYLASLTRETIPRSPSLRPTTTDPGLKVAYLLREIQLLKNDLNFERYLKQQHLSHIGQLRRKQIREARVEAETQNLINSNRGLKSKLEEAKRLNLQMKKEHEKSKTHSRKWESDLSAKLRILREEQKKWNKEREEFLHDLAIAKDDTLRLKNIVLESERRELNANQKVQSVESSLDELERLRVEVAKLEKQVLTYEVAERAATQAKEDREAALGQVKLLELQLAARDDELLKAHRAFESELGSLRHMASDVADDHGLKRTDTVQRMIDSALAASRYRIDELQKAHEHLLKRYTALQASYTELREQNDQLQGGDDALLAVGSLSASPYRSNSPSPRSYHRRSHASSDPETSTIYEGTPLRPARIDTSYRSISPVGGRSPTSASGGAVRFNIPQPYSPSGPSGTTRDHTDNESMDSHGKPKIKPQSEVRIYGRGGVQNIGKKEDKDKKGKEKEPESKDTKKEKKGVGIRGIRGFV